LFIEPILNDVQLMRATIGVAVVVGAVAWCSVRAKMGKYPIVAVLKKVIARED